MKPWQMMRLFGQDNSAPPASGYPTLLSMTSGKTTDASTVTITLPTTANGDLLVLVLGRNGSARTVIMPSPWVDSVASAASDCDTRAFYRTCDGSESGTTISITFSGGAARGLMYSIFRFSAGSWSGAPEAIRSSVATSDSPNPPSLSPSWGSAKTFWIAACTCRQGGLPVGYPFTDGQATQQIGASDGFASCWTQQEGASLDPGTFSLSASASNTAATIAIRPA